MSRPKPTYQRRHVEGTLARVRTRVGPARRPGVVRADRSRGTDRPRARRGGAAASFASGRGRRCMDRLPARRRDPRCRIALARRSDRHGVPGSCCPSCRRGHLGQASACAARSRTCTGGCCSYVSSRATRLGCPRSCALLVGARLSASRGRSARDSRRGRPARRRAARTDADASSPSDRLARRKTLRERARDTLELGREGRAPARRATSTRNAGDPRHTDRGVRERYVDHHHGTRPAARAQRHCREDPSHQARPDPPRLHRAHRAAEYLGRDGAPARERRVGTAVSAQCRKARIPLPRPWW